MERDSNLFKMFGKFFPQGTILFNVNDPGEEMYYIQSGTIGVRGEETPSDEAQLFGQGDILGEEAFLEPAPRQVMAEVVEDSRLLVIDVRNISSVVRNGPELAASIMGEIMERLGKSWSGLRAWQQRFFLRKIGVLFRRSEPEKCWSIREISEQTEIGEESIRTVFEILLRAEALRKEGDSFRVVNLEAMESLTSDTQ